MSIRSCVSLQSYETQRWHLNQLVRPLSTSRGGCLALPRFDKEPDGRGGGVSLTDFVPQFSGEVQQPGVTG